MPTLKQVKEKRGGKRMGSGAKLGSVHAANAIVVERKQNSQATLQMVEEYIQSRYQELIDTMFAASKRDWKAADALMNRGFGKAKESIVHSGAVGIAVIIKQITSSDEADGNNND